MEILLIALTAFLAAILTFFSGFGLGTILAPVFMIFFPVEVAIALTGIVHFLNNLFKLILVGKNANREVLLKFGIPAVIAAFLGSLVLINLSDINPIFSYSIFGKVMNVFPIKLLIAVILIVFSIFELIPNFQKLQFSKDKLLIGGFLSGFFGGLSGNQGALRSAFLIKCGLSKESFIGTTVVISSFVDFTRLSVYSTKFLNAGLNENMTIVIIAALSAMFGAFIGNKLLKKVTLKFLQISVAIMLIIISIALGSGLI